MQSEFYMYMEGMGLKVTDILCDIGSNTAHVVETFVTTKPPSLFIQWMNSKFKVM